MMRNLREIATFTVVTIFIGFIISVDVFFILPLPTPITSQEFVMACPLFTGFIGGLTYVIVKESGIIIQENRNSSLLEEIQTSIAIGFSLYIGIFFFTSASSLISRSEISVEEVVTRIAISSLLLSVTATLIIFLLIHFSRLDAIQ